MSGVKSFFQMLGFTGGEEDAMNNEERYENDPEEEEDDEEEEDEEEERGGFGLKFKLPIFGRKNRQEDSEEEDADEEEDEQEEDAHVAAHGDIEILVTQHADQRTHHREDQTGGLWFGDRVHPGHGIPEAHQTDRRGEGQHGTGKDEDQRDDIGEQLDVHIRHHPSF